MIDNLNADFQDREKKSLFFESVKGVGLGLVACEASLLIAVSAYASYVAGKPALPSLGKICSLLTQNKDMEHIVTCTALGFMGVSGAHSYAEAVLHNREIERNTSPQR